MKVFFHCLTIFDCWRWEDLFSLWFSLFDAWKFLLLEASRIFLFGILNTHESSFLYGFFPNYSFSGAFRSEVWWLDWTLGLFFFFSFPPLSLALTSKGRLWAGCSACWIDSFFPFLLKILALSFSLLIFLDLSFQPVYWFFFLNFRNHVVILKWR